MNVKDMDRDYLGRDGRVLGAGIAGGQRGRDQRRGHAPCSSSTRASLQPRRSARTRKPFSSFPKVTKAGLGVGGQFGEGALLQKGKAVAYYNTAGASVGPAGGRPAIRLRDVLHERHALAQLDKADGFEVGVGPTVVVMDEGKAKTMTTTTAKDDIYAFIFGQKGLMAGLGIQGNKITKITPK